MSLTQVTLNSLRHGTQLSSNFSRLIKPLLSKGIQAASSLAIPKSVITFCNEKICARIFFRKGVYPNNRNESLFKHYV